MEKIINFFDEENFSALEKHLGKMTPAEVSRKFYLLFMCQNDYLNFMCVEGFEIRRCASLEHDGPCCKVGEVRYLRKMHVKAPYQMAS